MPTPQLPHPLSRMFCERPFEVETQKKTSIFTCYNSVTFSVARKKTVTFWGATCFNPRNAPQKLWSVFEVLGFLYDSRRTPVLCSGVLCIDPSVRIGIRVRGYVFAASCRYNEALILCRLYVAYEIQKSFPVWQAEVRVESSQLFERIRASTQVWWTCRCIRTRLGRI